MGADTAETVCMDIIEKEELTKCGYEEFAECDQEHWNNIKFGAIPSCHGHNMQLLCNVLYNGYTYYVVTDNEPHAIQHIWAIWSRGKGNSIPNSVLPIQYVSFGFSQLESCLAR